MSTNYYIRNKEDNQKHKDQRAALDNLSPKVDKIFSEIESIILKINPDYESQINDRNQYVKEKITGFISENIPSPKEKHVGLSSAGWRFLFDIQNYNGLEDLKNKFDHETEIVVDEYEREILFDDLVNLIVGTRKNPKRNNDGTVVDESQTRDCDPHNEEGFRTYSRDFT